MAFYLFVACGVLAGILGGMGMGGGTLLIPLLSVAFGVPQKIAQCANLAAFVPMALISLKIHSDNGLVRFDDVLFVVLPAAAFSVMGSFAAGSLPSEWLRRGFGLFLCLLSVFQIFSAVKLFTQKRKADKMKA